MNNTPEIEEGNRLIADFMEYIHSDSEDMDRWEMANLKYHSSWDALMSVVEKISRIEFERLYDEYLEKWVIWTHHPVTFGMLDEKDRPMVRFYGNTLHYGDTLIQAAWNAVVDFIKWHQVKTPISTPIS